MLRILTLAIVFILVITACSSPSERDAGDTPSQSDAPAASGVEGSKQKPKEDGKKPGTRTRRDGDAQAKVTYEKGDVDWSNINQPVRRRIAQHIVDAQISGAASQWGAPVLADKAVPLFIPGKPEPAYLEIKVKPKGLVVVSLGDHDSPIVEWSADASRSISDRLRASADARGLSPGKIYRLGPLSYAIETPEGELITVIGHLPPKPAGIAPTYLKNAGDFPITEEVAIYDEKNGYGEITAKRAPPKTQAEAWGSWGALKTDWMKARGPIMVKVAQAAKGDWAFEREQSKSGRGLNPCDGASVALIGKVKNVDITGPANKLVRSQVDDGDGGIPQLSLRFGDSLCGQKDAGKEQSRFSVAVEYASGEKETLRFFLDPNAAVKAKTAMLLPSVNAGWEEQSRFVVDEPAYNNYRVPQYSLWTEDMHGDNCFPNLASLAWAEVFAWGDINYLTANSQGKRRFPDWGLYRNNGYEAPRPDSVPSSRPFGYPAPEFRDEVNRDIVFWRPSDAGPRFLMEGITAKILGYNTFENCVEGEGIQLRPVTWGPLDWIRERRAALHPSEAARAKRYVDGRSAWDLTTAHAHYKGNRNNDRDLSWKAYDILAATDYAVGGGAGTKHDYALPVVVGYNHDNYASVWGVRWLAKGKKREKFEFMLNWPVGPIYTDVDEVAISDDDTATFWISSDIFFVGWIDPHFAEARKNQRTMELLRSLQVVKGQLEREDKGERPRPLKTPDGPMKKPTPRSK